MSRALVAGGGDGGTRATRTGGPDAVSTINFKPGDPNEIAAGLTFGLVLSHDGRRSWHWMCEKAVGYGGLWDPDYAYTADGALFATTFSGLKVMTRWLRVRGGAAGHDVRLADRGLSDRRRVLRGARIPHDGNIYRSDRRRRDVHDLDRTGPRRRLVGIAEVLDRRTRSARTSRATGSSRVACPAPLARATTA